MFSLYAENLQKVFKISAKFNISNITIQSPAYNEILWNKSPERKDAIQ